jgi:hypothetical protein
VTIPDPASRPLIAAAACLLDQGRVVDGLSRLLTAAALLVLLLPAVLPAGPHRLPAVILAAVALLAWSKPFLRFASGSMRLYFTGSRPDPTLLISPISTMR